jgi:hypothetical protein
MTSSSSTSHRRMPEGSDHEAYLTADYNAETIEHIERYPRVRDRAICSSHPAQQTA